MSPMQLSTAYVRRLYRTNRSEAADYILNMCDEIDRLREQLDEEWKLRVEAERKLEDCDG